MKNREKNKFVFPVMDFKTTGIEDHAKSAVFLVNNAVLFVEDSVDTIDRRMLDNSPTIHFKVSAIARKATKKVYKDDIDFYFSM